MTARAGQWLARTLPTGLLHEHLAERAIRGRVVRLLTRSATTTTSGGRRRWRADRRERLGGRWEVRPEAPRRVM